MIGFELRKVEEQMTPIAATTKMSSEEVSARVEELRSRADQLLHERVIGHRFTQELCQGKLTREKFVGFLKNWYAFAVEIKGHAAPGVDHELYSFQTRPDADA